ncbi:MAG: F0F1 ATP synthase subunit epsilon [Candidatus Dactylopiibacterium carminicum]|uniref:ATP synthase epsilon chain n=1 Tax=Candidatus Dactylopiibacterium carminicum TaxID=857335 RepID=A0A272EMY4_9RHOO|nr:F0F1 ATP synthase subunit epsilon [Candidatus Dactylopiibacterium carminicum]KAF7597896.1 F0F1 ATP synthase subunit epsilon [Candidatus Dactylopiibacterium carminicum]PAS91477.1 MAG: F0F1 ATP synthase subunit epsilon [Candidatus Dactylopiibacterium carminicum]PAS92928.1 MAG: F0F1 ATP synthase subunit epsilon [Candidatus Dactylopiibacterium carminicum]PAS95887.1 MAG: F0F1 ATP synthase subunit epsilon [Candidatus Dactylopiibacterium carminicum]
MAMTVHVDVVNAEEELFSGLAEIVSLPGESGDLGILPGHTPLMTRIRPGTVRIKVPGRAEEEVIFVAGGLLEVQPNLVTVMADTAIRGKDLDEAKALEAKKHAEQALADKAHEVNYAQAQAELAEAIAQLATINQARRRSH